jgi:glyoxylase-like metal-dependent hydrolase (beta-lactamase superfamily II)
MFLSDPHATIRLDRRKFLGIAAGLVAAGVLPSSVLALAGPHSFKHGAFDLTVVSDGTLELPITIVSKDAPPEELAKLIGAMVKGDKFYPEVNVVVAKSGSDMILFDAGAGSGMAASAGKLAESLKAAGVDPAAITKVVFTHAHPDHLFGALGADGKPVYANASFHMAETEYNFWAAPDLASKMPEAMQGMVKGIQGSLAGLKEKIATFKGGAELLPGVGVIDTPGHTPGHVSFELAGGDGLVLVGDAITVPGVFFAHPDWAFGFDADGATAGKSRRMLLEAAATGKKKMLGYHWAYPGLGMAEAKDGAFVYLAAI